MFVSNKHSQSAGNQVVDAERLVDAEMPDGIIPFKIDRAEATSALYEWCKNGILTPVNFIKDSNIAKLTGLYVPFWLFDCDVDLDISADANTINYIHSGGRQSNYITKTTSSYKIIRKSKIHWEKIPFDGVSQVDDALMEDIEPFDYGAIEAFDMKHLTGFLIDKYDESPQVLEKKLNSRLNQYCKTFFESSASQYSDISNIVDQSVLHKPISRYTLFPVWMLNYTYLGKTYTFAMNGQTGKVSGKPPKSIGKIIFLGLVFFRPLLLFSDASANGSWGDFKMSAQTENSKPKTGKFTAYFAVTAAIGTLLVAFAGTFVFLYVNMIRSEETSNLFKDKAGILARNVFGSPLLGVDIFSIIVSILLLAVILFVLFRRKEEKAAVKWIDYIEPVSSETVEEKDQFCNRTKLIVDTTERSEFLDGENRFRGVGGFRTWPGGVSFQGGFFTGDARPEHTDSDGDPSH